MVAVAWELDERHVSVVGSLWQGVLSVWSVLERDAVLAVLLIQRDSSYHFGTIELEVRLEYVDRASALIADTDS